MHLKKIEEITDFHSIAKFLVDVEATKAPEIVILNFSLHFMLPLTHYM